MDLKIDSSLVGVSLGEIEHQVTWRETTNYAASVFDLNPRYLDDTSERGIIAHPMFAAALTWPIAGDIYSKLEGRLPSAAIPFMVHINEHLLINRPVRPGDRIKINGRVAAVLPSRAGTRLVTRLDALDAEGNNVFTEFGGVMFRGIGCSDKGRGKENLPDVPSVAVNDENIWSAEISVSKAITYIYDGCSDIVFSIHTSPAFARGAGLPGIIVQGTATLALAVRELVNREAGGEPERVKEISCRFSDMIFPGSKIRVELTGKEQTEKDIMLAFQVINEQGKTALKAGYARLSCE